MLTANQIRQKFLDYFQENGHQIIKSSPLIPPPEETTLLFTNSGMNQFKKIFLGEEELPKDNKITNSQHCLRVSGKHNDFNEVGRDSYHHTFFEMLGSWSFNDYSKEKAIDLAYDLLVNHYKLNPDMMYVTYFQGCKTEDYELPPDLETKKFWTKYFPDEKIIASSMKDNFWEMAEYGPCGESTEIHYNRSYLWENTEDHLTSKEAMTHVNQDDARVIEIWNLVFVNYNRSNNIFNYDSQKQVDEFRPLVKKFVDTGMGFERLVSILQAKNNNYHTDIFQPILDLLSKNQKIQVEEQPEEDLGLEISKQIVADHFRSLLFLCSEGLVFGNKGREYILRKLFRRAYYHLSHHLGFVTPIEIFELLVLMVNYWQGLYPDHLSHDILPKIGLMITNEIISFKQVLKKGNRKIDKFLKTLGSGTVFDDQKLDQIGKEIYGYYHTIGMPNELTLEIMQIKLPSLKKHTICLEKSIEKYFHQHQKKSRAK